MELLVATWTLRVAIVAALAVGVASYEAGASLIDCVDRALFAAVGFTFAGRMLAGWLEPPEVKMLRLRRRREAQRVKARKGGASAKAGAPRSSRSTSTISRSA
jgi:hypothetical protein